MSVWTEFVHSRTERATQLEPLRVTGRVVSLVGTLIEAVGLSAEAGALMRLESPGCDRIEAEVVGFRGERCLLMALGDPSGIAPGASVVALPRGASLPTARAARGRVIDGLGRPLDGGPPLLERGRLRLSGRPRPALARERVDRPLDVGVRAINSLLTVGRGARLGLFAGSGVGKSTLLGQIARFTQADSVVVALIGERGREVREFVEGSLGDALERSIVVVATSDEAPVLRRRAAWLATALAEELSGAGQDVLFLMDSLSRFSGAQREIGLAAGEPPATRGFPPSVWSALPRLVERAGTQQGPGSITALYTVLVEGEANEDPIADAIRSLLDGHIVLSRRLAERGQHPAIDPLASVSRVMNGIVPPEAQACAARARALLATYADAEDLVSIGAYQAGSDPRIDEALRLQPALREFLCQPASERAELGDSFAALAALLPESDS